MDYTSTSSIISEVPAPQLNALPRSLDAIFRPQRIAVIGATERVGSVGHAVTANLLASPEFAGRIFPVNPKRSSLLGVDAYPSILDVPGPIDLAVIATPAQTVPDVIAECASAGVGGAVILSAGFREVGAKGAALEARILATARAAGMRVVGPNCLGVMNPLTGLNATFAAARARPGNVAFLSQSGALCTAILDWSLRELFGFSAFVSVGTMLDVGWGDLLDYFGNDPRTQSILIYMESIGDARSFLAAAREVALNKPILVIKAGRSDVTAKAVVSHTGSLAGGDDVVDAALSRAGVLRVNNLADLFYMAEALARQPRPRGPRLTVLTNAGGPGVLAADATCQVAGELAVLSEPTMVALNSVLPSQWSHSNPVDILGDAEPERYAKAIAAIADDSNSDGLLVILTPQAMTDPLGTAKAITQYAKSSGKPILASWMGGASLDEAVDVLNRAGIPTFPFPDTSARIFNYMWRYSRNLAALYETPVTSGDDTIVDTACVDATLADAHRENRTLLNEVESKRVLRAYGIPIVRTEVAATAEAAVAIADSLGYPVVLKIFGKLVTHKTDVDGVRLDLANREQVRLVFESIRSAFEKRFDPTFFEGVSVQQMVRDREAYELIIGSSVDPQFGPVLLFGAGGQLVEIFHDRALALPPLNTTLATRMMEQTKIFKALQGVRGRRPVDIRQLANVLVNFSRLAIEQPWIKEIDINPLLVSPDRVVALDARIILHPAHTPAANLTTPVLRPYPSQYVTKWTLPNGHAVTIRPIRPDDEPMMIRFHELLSDRSVHSRYFGSLKLRERVSHLQLLRCCSANYDKQLALVAELIDSVTGQRQVLALAQLNKVAGGKDAEFALLIADPWQGQGLGTEMLLRLVQIGKAEGIRRIFAQILAANFEMLRVCERIGFRVSPSEDGELVNAELNVE